MRCDLHICLNRKGSLGTLHGLQPITVLTLIEQCITYMRHTLMIVPTAASVDEKQPAVYLKSYLPDSDHIRDSSEKLLQQYMYYS